MNEVFKNTHIFVDVLSMARCDSVQEWDEAAFRKAYKWAQYFEEVYHKLKKRPSLSEKLDKYLANFKKSGQVYLGSLTLSFDLLGKSKMLLRKYLLQNPHVSDKQYQMVLQLYDMKLGGSRDCVNTSDLLKDVSSLTRVQAAVYLLSQMRDKLTDDMQCTLGTFESGDSPAKLLPHMEDFPNARDSDEVIVSAAAHCLFDYIQHQLRFTGPQHRKLLHEKLDVLAVQENGLKSIVSSLLLAPEDCVSGQEVDTVSQFVLEWLVGFLSCNKPQLMYIHPLLLSRAAFLYEPFFKLYLSHLVSWTRNMVPRICSTEDDCHTSKGIEWSYEDDGSGANDKPNQKLTFTSLLSHWRHLLACPAPIADVTKKTIHSYRVEETLPSTGNKSCNGWATLTLNCSIWEDICALSIIGTQRSF